MWDTIAGNAVKTMAHGAPIEDPNEGDRELRMARFSPDGSRLVMLELYTGGVRVYDATPVNRAFRPSAPSPKREQGNDGGART